MQGMMAGMQARAAAKVPDTTPTLAMADYAGISVILDIAGSDPVPGRKYSKRLRLMCLRA